MPELWRILPANGESPILFTTREQLDHTMISCNAIAADRNARPGQRAAARTVAKGRIQVAARLEWADSE
jgi:hypothetical protein